MLFLGTEKYPDENSYSAYLNEHGGYSNAYTASEATNYHFCVANNGLKEALDRFSSFFFCPFFTETATGRELQAVDSEHKKNLQQDMWRSYQLDKSTSHPSHPYHKFGTGDSRTLRDIPATKGIDVRSALLKFHKEHYSSSRMSLAILGSETVDTLESWAREYFSGITNNHSNAPVFNGHPYNGPENISPSVNSSSLSSTDKRYNGLIQYVVPVKDCRTLSISWALPEQKSDWKSKSGRYLSHILGHEGPGTILSHLKVRGWATELYAGTDSSDSGFSIFNISVELSDDGFAHVDDVQMIIYAYLGVLQAHGPQKWIFEEEALQAVQTFRFLAKGQPFHYVTQLTGALQDYPMAQTVSGNYLFWEWNPKNVERYLAYFTPENARVRVLAKSLKGDKTPLREPWYNTEYGEEILSSEICERYRAVTQAYQTVINQLIQTNNGNPVTSETTKTDSTNDTNPSVLPSFRTASVDELKTAIQNLQPRLTLPAPNDFLASDFEIRHPSLKDIHLDTTNPRSPCAKTVNDVRIRREPIPTLLRNDNRCEIWHHCDNFFAVPKLYAYIQLNLANAYNSPRASVLMELYIRLVKEALTDYAYAAAVAGLNSDANSTPQGANFFFYGFSHKLARLVARAGDKTANLTFSDMLFDVQKDKYEKQLENWTKESPYRHAMQRVSLALSFPLWTSTEKIAAIKTLTANDLRAFIPEFLRTVNVRMLVSGNGTSEEALAVADAFMAPLLPKSVAPNVSESIITRMVQLPAPITVQHSDSTNTLVNFEFLYSIPALNPADPNGAMEMTLQIGEGSVGSLGSRNVYTELAGHILSEPYFDVLRTQQQLGYIVNASVKHDYNIQGLRFIVQSGKVAPEDLIVRTDAFLTAYLRTLEDMPVDKFAANVRAVAIKRSEADKNLSYEANRLWEEILSTLEFTRATNDVDALFKISQNDFVEWYRQHIAPGGSARRAFAALVEKGTAPADGTTEAEEEEGEEETPTPSTAAETESKGTESSAEETKKVPQVITPPLPVVDIPLADAGVILHALRVLSKSTVSWTEFTNIMETSSTTVVSAEIITNIQKAIETNKTNIRIRIVVPAEESSPAVIRTMLPAYPDNGSIYRNAYIRKLKSKMDSNVQPTV